jgi:hypothetical protein
MTMVQPSPTMFVTLRESTIAKLMALREDGETLDAVAARCADAAVQATPATSNLAPGLLPPTPEVPTTTGAARASTWPTTSSGLYVMSVLGEAVRANTLGGLLRNVVDAVHDLDAAAIERLSRMKARTRRYVSRAREDVHAGRRDLRVLQTRSGWWVSANIGRRDFVRSVRALCAASDLRYGSDIRFPA